MALRCAIGAGGQAAATEEEGEDHEGAVQTTQLRQAEDRKRRQDAQVPAIKDSPQSARLLCEEVHD